MYIPTFEMPTAKLVHQLIQHSDDAFSIDIKDTSLHSAIVNHYHYFVGHLAKTLSIKGFSIWVGHSS